MADIDDRWFRKVRGADGKVVFDAKGKPVLEPTDRFEKGLRYAARWRDDRGVQRSKGFRTLKDAERHLAHVAVDLDRGQYVDPQAGRTTLRRYATDWLALQTFDESTREATEQRLRVHVFPVLGDRQLKAIRPTVVQAWVRGLQAELATSYVRVMFSTLSAILRAAVDDRLIPTNPCQARSVRPPAAEKRRVVPWPAAWVNAVRQELPGQYREMVTAAAGLGLRQGEVIGLAVEDIDWLRGVVHVRRQVKIVGGKLVFAAPKGDKARDVPLPRAVSLRLAAHLEEWPAVEVTLPWRMQTGAATTANLIFAVRTGKARAITRNSFNHNVWRPALKRAGIPATRDNMMHALRHRFASVVLDAGASIRELAEWLGHSDPGFTLRTYTHLMPGGSDRMRSAIDDAFAAPAEESSESAGAPDVG